MTVRIRTLRPADRDGMVDLIQALNRFEAAICDDRLTDRAAAEAGYDAMLRQVAGHQGRVIVAEAGGLVVGFASFMVREGGVRLRPRLRRYGYVGDLVVHEDWRRRGTGRALLDKAEELAREHGLERLMLGVLAGNGGAQALYEAFGFRPYATELVKTLR